MPLIAQAHSFPLDADLSARLSRMDCATPQTPPSSNATFYVAWFNSKPVAAAWVVGDSEAREIQQYSIHPATRGRDVLEQFTREITRHEQKAANTISTHEDYKVLDSSVSSA